MPQAKSSGGKIITVLTREDPDVDPSYGFTNNYDRVRDEVLLPQNLSEDQVQVLWINLADPAPTTSLPSSNSDAYALEAHLGDVVRAAKIRYPNLQQIFISSRNYAGYALSGLNPEPYAYEYGFSVKWLIQAIWGLFFAS